MDQSQAQLETQVDLKRLQKARKKAAAKAAAKAGKTRVGPLARIARGAGLGGMFGKLPK